jgi:hypothetical protein
MSLRARTSDQDGMITFDTLSIKPQSTTSLAI